MLFGVYIIIIIIIIIIITTIAITITTMKGLLGWKKKESLLLINDETHGVVKL